jgi:hypothetical protein
MDNKNEEVNRGWSDEEVHSLAQMIVNAVISSHTREEMEKPRKGKSSKKSIKGNNRRRKTKTPHDLGE